ncbi:GNAT family N-acetyltransferase [Wenyingzhuangia sp. IMCC45574]
MKISLRKANLQDLKEIQQLFVESINHTCNKDYNTQQIKVWTASVKKIEKWSSKLTSQYFIVAETQHKIIGFASLEQGNYFDLLYVHKDFLRKGVASLLYNNIKKEALLSGFQKLHTKASITAVPFFKTKGFTIKTENKNRLNGVEIINYDMEQ